MRCPLVIIVALATACGAAHLAVVPRQEALIAGFPSKPYSNQHRPGSDGRCGSRFGPPTLIVKGGGCWVSVEMELSDCAQASKEGDYHVVHDGRCYYPLFKLPVREPTSILETIFRVGQTKTGQRGRSSDLKLWGAACG